MAKLSWHTAHRRVDELVGHPKNPRTLSDEQREALKHSLQKFNLAELPVVDTHNRILAGHQRIKVLQLLGRGNEMIEVRIPSRPLSEREAEQYLLISNAVHGSWSFDLLRTFDTDLLLEIGFNPDDLNTIFDNNLVVEGDDFDVEKELKKIKEPTVKLGELYALGNHRLICADSCDEVMVRKLVGNERMGVINTDPPYNISLKYSGTKGQYGGAYQDNKSDEDYRLFLRSLIKNSVAVCKENAHIFFWSDQKYIGMVQNLYRECGIDTKRTLIWVKGADNPVPQIAWNKSYEPCTYGVIGRPYLSPNVTQFNEFMNRDFSNGVRLIDDIGDFFDLWLVRRLSGQLYTHPAEKPAELYEKALRRCSRPGDNVLDLCAGSGSLLVACEGMKRQSFLSEADPIFATLILNRYEKFSGKKPKRIS